MLTSALFPLAHYRFIARQLKTEHQFSNVRVAVSSSSVSTRKAVRVGWELHGAELFPRKTGVSLNEIQV